MDRRKIVKVEEKAALKNKVEKAVKEELERLKKSSGSVFDNDGSRDSVCSESSFGSQPAPKRSSKNVSFSGTLEHTKVFDKRVKDLQFKPSDASPGRGILKTPTSAKKVKKSVTVAPEAENGKEMGPPKKRVKLSEKVAVTTEPADEENTEPQAKSTEVNDEPVFKKKRSIQVTKSVKEKLLTMDRKERKAFLKELKMKKKPEAARAEKCKQLWEKIRSSKTPTAEKDQAVHELVGLVKGHAAKLIYAHDTSRVIECLVSTEREGIINMLFDELTPEIVRMSKNVYSKFFVKKMLKNGNKHQRETIINAFRGHAPTLLRILHAAEVLEYAYNDFANAHQRFNIISEFYGKEFILFRPDTIKSLSQIISEEPSKKQVILKHLEETIEAVSGKETVRLSIVHKLMLDFFENCDEEKRTNMLDSLKYKIPEFIHTPDGARLAMKLVWFAPVKERKLIVKNFKDLSVKAAMEHYGHRVLLSIFDTVDDTVLVNKFIISELSNDIKRLVEDEWGEKVLHYLVHPRDGRGIDKAEIAFLQEGDKNAHSKKSKEDRYAQLYAGITESLYAYLAANLEELIFEKNKSKFVAACLETTSKFDLFDRKVPSEARKECNKAFVEIAKKDFIPMDQEGFHIIEHNSGHFVLMAVMRCDTDLPEDERLSKALVDGLSKQQLGSWISCNKGCHVLLKMLQVSSQSTAEKLKGAINRPIKENRGEASDDEHVIKITVSSVMQGVKKVVVAVREKCSVQTLKLAIEMATEVAVDKQILLYKGNELKENNATIADYGIKSDAEITMNVKMSTGLFTKPTATDMIFLVPAILPDNQDQLRKTIKTMNSVSRKPKKMSGVDENAKIWTPEKQLEAELTRNRMKTLLRRKKGPNHLSSTPVETPETPSAQYSPVSTPPPEAAHASGSSSNVSADAERVITDKELKLFFDPPESYEEYKRNRRILYLPPKNEQELLNYNKKFAEDRKTKCNACFKKLSAAQQTMVCKCRRIFCDAHRLPAQHLCKIDYKQDGRFKLKKDSSKVGSGGARKAKFSNSTSEKSKKTGYYDM
ncbi:unnamed protein product [Caenorhabditis bovis]|uniref:Uncharacterized protein n=1 Tax=Caenorhabditis bovis TaxID=2654633 RepID=A0A8S1FBX2_9PELO|nr:unnamed protein product [Caenorhabditis bovis]